MPNSKFKLHRMHIKELRPPNFKKKKTSLGSNCPVLDCSSLKVVSTTFILVCFFSLKESTCEARKNILYFTSKALFVLKKIKF